MSDLTKFLAEPRPGMTLDELAAELNQLAKIRDNARLAFCKRLAVAYLMIVGHTPRKGCRDAAPFYKWCASKIRSANGKQYTFNTIGNYLKVGFAKNPEKFIRELQQNTNKIIERQRALGSAMKRAVKTDDPPKVIPITRLRAQGLPTDVATEVNKLMTAWEQASPQARSQFIYLVTGKRIAA